MFTGLVEEVGEIRSITLTDEGARLGLVAPLVADGLALGDSVAVNGACLTAVEIGDDGFAVECVAETLRRTALGALRDGEAANLERALVAGARLGGHIVQGHVDATAEVRDARAVGDGFELDFGLGAEHLRYVVEKGSIALDGVSLTVASRTDEGFRVALIPHTIAHTTLGPDRVGTRVNVELDVIAKYVESLTTPYRQAEHP